MIEQKNRENEKIYIENGLTIRELEIQKKGNHAKKEVAAGNRVIVEYHRVIINYKTYILWNRKEDTLEYAGDLQATKLPSKN